MERPWITPDNVREYTSSEKVRARSDIQMRFDISRAENYVIYYTHNRFNTDEYTEKIPDDIKMALILLSEAYALKSESTLTVGGMKSETFDDYSYTIDTERPDLIADLQLGPMLDPFVLSDDGKVVMKLRML